MSVNKIKRITYLITEMAEKRQESCTSDGAVKITRKKRYQLGIENVSLKGLISGVVVNITSCLLRLVSVSCSLLLGVAGFVNPSVSRRCSII